MSRVDDDRQAQRVAERLAQEKRLQEERSTRKQEGESAFSRLLSKGSQEQGRTQKQQLNQAKDAQAKAGDREVREAGLGAHEVEVVQEQGTERKGRERADVRRGAASFGEKLNQARGGEGERAAEGRLSDAGREGLAAGGRTQDQATGQTRAESRRQDAKLGQDAHEDRGASSSKTGAGGSGAAAARGGKGDLKSDADGGGKGNSGGNKDGKDGSGELAGGFRFNPALMAPVPVAKPKENRGSEKLRALANEIAQKIVQSARVGTNAAGKAEFQIDLRSNVLSGLSIKVSGGNGKIRAVFSGSDREVLKMLKAESESLRQALGGRGLTLEELRIEERA
jgi:hypothetical protein